MRVSVAIMCAGWDRDRMKLADELMARLNASERFESVVVIPATRKTGEAWTLAERCWMQGIERDTTYHLVLQEDVMPCTNFEDEVIKALSAHVARHGPAPVGFYCTYPEAQTAQKAGDAWLETYDGAWGQAIALSNLDISEFLYWTRLNIPAEYKHDDERIGLWSLLTGRRIFQTVPSLVDHAQIKSTLGHKWHNAASTFANGHPCPNWRTQGVHIAMPRFSRAAAEKILRREFEWPKELEPKRPRTK
jgi:hypothetical protein